MNIEKKQIDALDLQVTINIQKEDYSALEKKRLNDRKRTAEFKGFRKGMVPMSLIQRVYGEQALVEAVNEVISEALNSVIKEDNIRMVGEPLTSEEQPEVVWESGNDFVFKFDIATTSEVNFELTKEDKVPYYAIEVSDEAKKEMKENMLRQMGSLQDGEKAGENDFVIVNFDNGEIKSEEAYVAVSKVEGEAKNLFVGCKAGDQFDIDVNEAFVDETDRAAMLKVKKEEVVSVNPKFHAVVVSVKTFVSAEENQETFDKMFGEGVVKTAEEFDKAVEERLVDNYKQEADYRLSKDMREYLVKKAEIELPESFLKRWLLHVNEGKFTMEEIEKEFDAFLADYKWQMVRSYIMDKFSLKIEDKDMIEAAEAYVAYQYAMYGMGNVPPQILSEMALEVLKKENQARQIEDNVENQKVIAAVREAVTLQKKKTTVEKFRNLK